MFPSVAFVRVVRASKVRQAVSLWKAVQTATWRQEDAHQGVTIGPAGIDAYLWIKDPGASDGPCHGGPPAGQDWPKYAAALASASQQ